MRSSLIGQYAHSVDPKNRLFIPPKFRDELAKEGKKHFVLTKGFDECVYMYLPSDWDRAVAHLTEMKLANKDQERLFKRIFFAHAVEVEVDGQGRVLLPQSLKDKAGLKKEVVVNGAGSRIELWDSRRWTALERKAEPVLRRNSAAFDI